MLMPELKSPQRHPPSPKELGETEVKLREKNSFSALYESLTRQGPSGHKITNTYFLNKKHVYKQYEVEIRQKVRNIKEK